MIAATNCRVCGTPCPDAAFDDAGPSLTSIRTVIDVPTQVFLCENCGHAQSPDLPDLEDFYDTQYRISLDIDGHDQLYENAAGEQVFRTAYQAEMVLDIAPPIGAKILDFGAGKATTLQRIVEARPDLQPFVFDVSTDYVSHWATWIPESQQSTYQLPDEWSGQFDFITAHFVLEHVADPVAIFQDLRRCLAPKGQLFFTVPDADGNTGDLLVVDHLNHFSRASLLAALGRAGLVATSIDTDRFGGAFVVVARPGEAFDVPPPDTRPAQASLDAWAKTLLMLREQTLPTPIAIYGAGFYGSVIAARLANTPECFLDRNPFLQGQLHLNSPVLSPEDCPADVKTVVVGLNPKRAREILSSNIAWLPEQAELIYLDG